jgi:hypothetical protein
VVNVLNQFDDPFPDPAVYYDMLPYGASGNVNNPGGDISFNFSNNQPGSKQQLVGALKGSANFFYLGHGSPTKLMPNFDSGIELDADEIAKALGNPPYGDAKIGNPYKLVILVGCNAYSKAFADAFGIVDYTNARPTIPLGDFFALNAYLSQGRSKYSVQDYLDKGKYPQAFVAWPCQYAGFSMGNFSDGDSITDANSESSDLGTLFDDWQNGFPIDQCMTIFSNGECGHFSYIDPVILKAGLAVQEDSEWELSGCHDLRTTDRNP